MIIRIFCIAIPNSVENGLFQVRSPQKNPHDTEKTHNYSNYKVAGKLAGLTELPAIVKMDLTEKEAYVYVICDTEGICGTSAVREGGGAGGAV